MGESAIRSIRKYGTWAWLEDQYDNDPEALARVQKLFG
jgi:hypothetical protein